MYVEHISEGADAVWKTVVGLSPREAWGYIPASFTAYDFFFFPQFPDGSSDSGLIKCMVNSLL